MDAASFTNVHSFSIISAVSLWPRIALPFSCTSQEQGTATKELQEIARLGIRKLREMPKMLRRKGKSEERPPHGDEKEFWPNQGNLALLLKQEVPVPHKLSVWDTEVDVATLQCLNKPPFTFCLLTVEPSSGAEWKKPKFLGHEHSKWPYSWYTVKHIVLQIFCFSGIKGYQFSLFPVPHFPRCLK